MGCVWAVLGRLHALEARLASIDSRLSSIEDNLQSLETDLAAVERMFEGDLREVHRFASHTSGEVHSLQRRMGHQRA